MIQGTINDVKTLGEQNYEISVKIEESSHSSNTETINYITKNEPISTIKQKTNEANETQNTIHERKFPKRPLDDTDDHLHNRSKREQQTNINRHSNCNFASNSCNQNLPEIHPAMDRIVTENREKIETNSEPGRERSRERLLKEQADRLIIETILEKPHRELSPVSWNLINERNYLAKPGKTRCSNNQIKAYRPPAPHRQAIKDIDRRLLERYNTRFERQEERQQNQRKRRNE